jgi:outer membrane protein assembly factor BamA
MPVVRSFGVYTVLVVCACATAFPRPGPTTIRSVTIERLPVFDTPTGNILESAANSLHWTTTEATVRNELLFQEGDSLNSALIDETERNLRALPILTGAWIQVVSDSTDSVDVVVRTRDKWSLGGRVTYRQGGGLSAIGMSLVEGNMFGNGQSVGIGYLYQEEDRASHGMSFELADRRLFSSRWGASFRHANGRDLTMTSLEVGRPYYSDAATWAAGAVFDVSRERLRYYDRTVLTRDSYRSQDRQGAWASISNGEALRLYAGVGYLRTRSDVDPSFLQTIDNIDMGTVSFGMMHRQYYESGYLNSLGVVEDVPAGFHLAVAAGYGRNALRSDRPLVQMSAIWQHAMHVGTRYYVGYEVSGSTFFQGRSSTDSKITAQLVQHVRLLPQHTIVARVRTMLGSNWSSSVQPSLATSNSLRGYSTYALAGHRIATGNIEYRFTPDVTLWIFRLGGALFHDAGAAWGDADPWAGQHFRHTTGFGLRIENTIRGGNDLLRIDFPFSHDGKRFTQVMISGNQLLSAFLDMPILDPLHFN